MTDQNERWMWAAAAVYVVTLAVIAMLAGAGLAEMAWQILQGIASVLLVFAFFGAAGYVVGFGFMRGVRDAHVSIAVRGVMDVQSTAGEEAEG